ncbi:MAG TPA: YciI family protein [Chitinophagaceae bacterium]|nr:YciI family protein [Chitinophagaceae bacterium]
MLIFHGGLGARGKPLSPEVMQEEMGKWMAWIDKLVKADKYVTGEPLLPGGKLVSGPDKKITDGLYKEGAELIGGFFIIKAADINEAVEISKDCPDFAYGGSVQVRQVMKM